MLEIPGSSNRKSINKAAQSITLSNVTLSHSNTSKKPYMHIQWEHLRNKDRRSNRNMYDNLSDNIVISLTVLFFLVISVLLTLMIKEIRTSVTEYNKHCTQNYKIDIV